MRASLRDNPTLAHTAPFVAWVLLLMLPGAATGWGYALLSLLAAALLAWARPWRWYGPPRLRCWPLAAGAGVLVFVVWVLPETPWIARAAPRLHDAYLTFGVDLLQLSEPAAFADTSPYAPAVAGWGLALCRLLGSAFVIAVAEEFFWRGFLARTLVRPAFETVDLGAWHPGRFLLVAVLFGLEHQRWAVGIAAGLVYGLLAVRTRDIWSAVTAHVITNLLLGLYVLRAGAYRFWG